MGQLQGNVKKVLVQICPIRQRDNGDGKFVEPDLEKMSNVRLAGACEGLPNLLILLRKGIEKDVRSKIPYNRPRMRSQRRCAYDRISRESALADSQCVP